MLMETFETQSHRLMSFSLLLFLPIEFRESLKYGELFSIARLMMMKIDYWHRVIGENVGKVSLFEAHTVCTRADSSPLIIFNGKNQSQSDSRRARKYGEREIKKTNFASIPSRWRRNCARFVNKLIYERIFIFFARNRFLKSN